MPTASDEIRQSLINQDVEFRRLAEEHSRCESQLEKILKQPYMCSEDFIEEIALKKMKLRLKDRMEMIVSRYQRAVPH
ncbi:MAG TPA: YdcH family protein [Candidatus Aquilonibacter sp.]|nr:YdcH family protein [Candidatus Aquilonibacter sp.]